MSSDAFKAFMAKVSADQGLREKLRAAGGDAGISTQALVDFANGQGYVFSAADVTGELSDAELGAASGGLAYTFGTMPALTDKSTPMLSFVRTGSEFLIKLT